MPNWEKWWNEWDSVHSFIQCNYTVMEEVFYSYAIALWNLLFRTRVGVFNNSSEFLCDAIVTHYLTLVICGMFLYSYRGSNRACCCFPHVHLGSITWVSSNEVDHYFLLSMTSNGPLISCLSSRRSRLFLVVYSLYLKEYAIRSILSAISIMTLTQKCRT